MATPTAADSEAFSSSPAMPRLSEWPGELVEPRSCPDVERLFRRRVGFVPRMAPYICPHPWVYRAVLFLVDPQLQALDEDLFMQVCFVVARDHACRYCYGSLRAFLRVAGYSESELDRLEDQLYLRGRQDPERAVSELAISISEGRTRHTSAVSALKEAGYSKVAIREIAGSALLDTITTRTATLLAAPIDTRLEEVTTPWYFDLLQPVLKALLSGWRRLGTSPISPLAPEEIEGPFASWLSRLQGTSIGRVLHNLVNQWIQGESALPVRAKLLVLAVVGRALSCEELGARVRELLVEETELAKGSVETAVEHLRGDAVSEREAKLLRLARASVRYDPHQLQPKVREYARDLSREEIIDAVSTLGVSNALARLCTLDSLDR